MAERDNGNHGLRGVLQVGLAIILIAAGFLCWVYVLPEPLANPEIIFRETSYRIGSHAAMQAILVPVGIGMITFYFGSLNIHQALGKKRRSKRRTHHKTRL